MPAAALALFLHSEDDWAELDSACPLPEALRTVADQVWSPEDLRHYTAAVQVPGDCQEWEDGTRVADSASFLHSRASHSRQLDVDDTRRWVVGRVSSTLPNTHGCSTRDVRPNSIPNHPIPTAGCW